MEEKKSMDSVHYFIQGLFRGMTETEKIAEQREELEAHINDRIGDMMARGVSHDAAFSRVVESLGNLDELIDTITGERKKIYAKRMDWYMMAGGVVFGTFYMLAVGIWFWFNSFGIYAVCVAIPGWLGFAIPALIKLVEFRRQPNATEMIAVDISGMVRSSIVGWAMISLACWIVNVFLFNSGTFLSVVWAWMPMVGIMTWPLMTAASAWMIKHLKSLEPKDAV
jgi:hypothetical protein